LRCTKRAALAGLVANKPHRTPWVSAARKTTCWLRSEPSPTPALRMRPCQRSTSAAISRATATVAIRSALINFTRLDWSLAVAGAHVVWFAAPTRPTALRQSDGSPARLERHLGCGPQRIPLQPTHRPADLGWPPGVVVAGEDPDLPDPRLPLSHCRHAAIIRR